MSNLPATLSYQQVMMPIDPGAIAAAESVKARIQAQFIMAMQRPRNYMDSRTKILDACRRPEFAKRVEWSKVQGKKQDAAGKWVNNIINGPTIRFAELAVREWGNVNVETQIVYEDDMVRRVKVMVIDLETNATFGKECQIKKTVERKKAEGREIVGTRKNTYNEDVFIVLATDEEVANKEAALISKIIRNEGLRLIPQDIVDDAIAAARVVLGDRDAKDPKAALKNIVDHFAGINVGPKQLELYLGHGLEIISPAELQELRGIYQAISAGEAAWAEYITKAEAKPADDLNEIITPTQAAHTLHKVEPAHKPTPKQAPKPAPEKSAVPEVMPPATPVTHKSYSNEELEGMRADMVMEIVERGATESEIEDIVGGFSKEWTAEQIDQIRGKILPNLLAEKMEA